jgi:feruloyl esterase
MRRLPPYRLFVETPWQCVCATGVILLLLSTRTPAAVSCEQLSEHDFTTIPDAPTVVEFATPVDAKDPIPGYCRVRGYVEQRVRLELRLPEKANWNGKLFMQGCRAYCGKIHIGKANDALLKGYATVATDMGHTGHILDAKWAYNNRAGEIDYAFRATHVVAVAAKAIISAWAGTAPKRAFFRGCSTGGRQGLIEAARFPNDFDGIVAGAPVAPKLGALNFYWTSTANIGVNGQQILHPEHVRLIHGAALDQCDAIDGQADGVIDDPRDCRFEPSGLACRDTQESSDCLSPAQVQAAERLYRAPVTSDGWPLTPGGHLPGGELNWLDVIVPQGEEPALYLHLAEENFRYLAFAEDPGPEYTIDQFNLDTDSERMNFMAHLSTGFLPDLRAFRDRGGKLILYHGWQDGPAVNTVDFYDLAVQTMGGYAATRKFFRLFMVPGMYHCGGGPGPNAFDFISAIEAWVEDDSPPDKLLGTHRDESGTAFYSRAVKAYPE